MASAVMLLVGRYLASSGALIGAHGAPLRKVALSLGVGCGASGYFVVRRLRGNPRRWVVPWPCLNVMPMLICLLVVRIFA